MEVLYARARQHPHVLRRTPAEKPERLLPPALAARVDVELRDIDEASTLLGAFIQTGGQLRQSRRQRLKDLVGEIPTVDLAKVWKSALKELRGELSG